MLSTATVHCILIFVLAHVDLSAGQNYAERSGSLHADADMFAVTDGEEDYGSDYYYDWSHVDAGIRRWNVEDYPHPLSEPWACHRKSSGYVCDPDNILSEQQGDELDTFIRRIFNETSCICSTCRSRSGGIQLGIALLKHTYRPYNEHPSKIIQSFSRNLRSKWNLGECDNDLLIVVVTEDRQSFTDVGNTTKKYISLREAYKIFLENKALFTAAHYFEGLSAMLKNYYQVTREIVMYKKISSKSQLTKGEITGITLGIILCIFILVIVAVMFYKKFKKFKDSNKGGKKTPQIRVPRNAREYQACKTEDDGALKTEETDDEHQALPPPESTAALDECKQETIVVYTSPMKHENYDSPPPEDDDALDESTVTKKCHNPNTSKDDVYNPTKTLSQSRQLLQTDM